MATGQDTLWEKFLQPLFGLMVDREELKELSDSINWDQECDRIASADLVYPEYYLSQNFHGITGGYLTSGAAVTYDPVTQYALPPNETWNREAVIKAVTGNPSKIIDLGCGTGSTTMLLKQAFPSAEVTGLDLSPQMLVMAEYKATQAGLDIQWLHGLAEATNLADGEFDLVTASLLFHETPVKIARSILEEAYRLLSPGGQIIILDGHQKTLRQTTWLTEIFEEPYINDYAAGSLDAWLGAAGFHEVRTEDIWWTNQLSGGVKSVIV
ncbi:class I SAM-dependent methyltransferase [Waterburya agarophytonicola K14]|uniref:Class I SAM-dependent methyltransferase n=1 Tax=Waterburya agarophytonicola KI4 TaxID=2874699 RepID=A0A964FH17_9CYAN|nr:class I SAM-dependent methyltransferase [Waterburya agarophytonicola]MCC0179545.1 class I SAM-dependent methyltransferase [Waterburya agarophytonicola KI4]